jgi:hypothetical protein
MKNYQHKSIEEPVAIAILASALLDEIRYIYKPLFKYISEQNYQITPDHFNPIRILVPLIEVSSKFEFNGDPKRLLQKLNVPKPNIIWPMFRHGLSHSVRPFFAVIKGRRTAWAIPQYPCDHYDAGSAVGIYAPKLLKDLESYLEEVRYKSGDVLLQTGIELY